jgi:flavodoxin
MHTLIVYFSKFGNTHKIAETIANSLTNNGNVRTIEFNQLQVDDLKEVELLLMGSPTHKMNLPDAVKPILDRIPKRTLPGTPAAVFDTSYKMSRVLNNFTASKRLAKKLRKMGGKLVVPPEIFHVTEREGPLYEGELERAQEWAISVFDKINNQESHQ